MSKELLLKVVDFFKDRDAPARYNIINGRLEHPNGKEWVDKDTNDLLIQLHRGGLLIKKRDLDTILESNTIPRYNPFDQFLLDSGNEAVDQGIIDSVIDTLPLIRPDIKPLIRTWLLQIPAAMHGKTNLRLALVLIGPQNSGKTEWFRRLLPLPLKQYFTEFNGSKANKDTLIQLCEHLIVLDDEFNHISQYNQTDMKRILSLNTVRTRRPYRRNPETLVRRAVVCATTNDMQILSDQSGNTRLIPVEITGRYNIDAYNQIDKSKLLVALNRVFLGTPNSYVLNSNQSTSLADLSFHYYKESLEEEFLKDKIELIKQSDPMIGRRFITSADVETYAKSFHQLTLKPQAVGAALTKMFGPRKTFQTDKGPRKGYDFTSDSQ